MIMVARHPQDMTTYEWNWFEDGLWAGLMIKERFGTTYFA
jgi:hypothetical protein